jgi:hypothetical protein
VASFADTAVEQVERTSRYLREHEPREIVGSVEQWARRQPALAIGGAMVLGVVAGRFLRSASPPSGDTARGGYATDGYRSSGRYQATPAYGGYGASSGYDAGGYDAGIGTGTGGYDTLGAAGMSGSGAAGSTGIGTTDDTVVYGTSDVDVIPDATLDDGIDELAAGTTRVTADSEVR